MTRNRIIYQSEALFASNITGTGSTDGKIMANEVTHLKRVQSISHSVEVTRTDVNVFDRLAALDRIILDEPTVSLDFNYLALDGYNESGIGLTTYRVLNPFIGGIPTNPVGMVNCLSGIIANNLEATKNYYILTVDEGLDADGVYPTGANGYGVIGIGNGFLTSYTFNAAVGELPNVDCSIEASNISFEVSDVGLGNQNPAIDTSSSSPSQFAGLVILPPANETGVDSQTYLEQTPIIAALRPGDIVLDFGANSLQMGGAVLPGMTSASSKQSAHIQNISIEVPLSRTPQNRLGNAFAFSRELDVPITVTMSVSANLADLDEGSLIDLICSSTTERNLSVAMYEPCRGSTGTVDDLMMYMELRGATLDSQNFDSSIGDNKTVDLTFTAQLGGPNDQSRGLFISGKHMSKESRYELEE